MCGHAVAPVLVTVSVIRSAIPPRSASIRRSQGELLAEDGGLDDFALGPQHTLVPLPGRAVAGQPRGQAGVASVQSIRLGLSMRVVEHSRVVGAAQQGVVQPAGRYQPAGKASEPSDPGGLVQPRTDQPDWRPPCQRLAAKPGTADVEPAVDQDVESETRSNSEAQEPDPAFGTVTRLHQLDSGHLVEAADSRQQLTASPGTTPEANHVREPPGALAQIPGIRSAPSIDHAGPCRKSWVRNPGVPARALVRFASCAPAGGAPSRVAGSPPAHW